VPMSEPVDAPLFSEFTERNKELRTFSKTPFSLQIDVPKTADGASISSTVSKKKSEDPLSATLSPSFEFKKFDTSFNWNLSTNEKVSLVAATENPLGFNGVDVELGFSRKWDKVDRPYKVKSLIQYRNELVAAHADGKYETGFGFSQATFSVAFTRGNWSVGAQPQFNSEEEDEEAEQPNKLDEEADPQSPISLDYGVMYKQADHSFNVGGHYDVKGNRIKFDWHHAPADCSLDYAVHFSTAVSKSGPSDPHIAVSGNWTWNPDTEVKANCSVKKSELRLKVASTQNLALAALLLSLQD